MGRVRWPGPSVAARLWAALPGMLALLAALLGLPLVSFPALVVALAVALARAPRGWSRDLPLAGLLCLTTITVVGLIGPVIGVHPVGSSAASRCTVALLSASALGLGQWGLKARDGVAGPRHFGLPLLPAGTMAALGALLVLLPTTVATGWMLAGDNLRHVVLVAQVQATGGMDYSRSSYPHAWHTVVAQAWSLAGASLHGAGGVRLIETTALMYWGLYAGLALVSGVLAAALAQRTGLGPRASSFAGLLGGCVPLWPQFSGVNLAQGFQTAVLAGFVLLACTYEVTVRRGSVRPVLACYCGLILVSHTWQLVLPAAITQLALAFITWRVARRVKVAAAIVASLATMPVCIPPLRALLGSGGVGRVANAGWLPNKPILVPALIVCGCLIWCWMRHRDRSLWPTMTAVLVTLAEAPALAIVTHASLTSYYIEKVFQLAVVMAAPAFAAGLVSLFVSVGRRRPRVLRSPAPRGVALAICAVCLLTPTAAPLGLWTSVDPDIVLSALASPGAASAQVVWIPGHESEAATARMLLDMYRAGATRERTPQRWLPVADECSLLRASADATVLSDASEVEVRARYGCISGLVVVPIKPTG